MLLKFMITLLTSIKSNSALVSIIKCNHLLRDSTEYKSKGSLRTIQFNNIRDWTWILIIPKRKKKNKLRFNQEDNLFKCRVHRLYSCNPMITSSSWHIVMHQWWALRTLKTTNLNLMWIKKLTEAIPMLK